MLGKVTGLYRPLAQVLMLAGALEVFSLISPFFLQWTIDNVIVSEDRDLLSTLAIGFGLLLLMRRRSGRVRACDDAHEHPARRSWKRRTKTPGNGTQDSPVDGLTG